MLMPLLLKYWRESCILVLLATLAWCHHDNRRLEAAVAAQPESKEVLGFDEHLVMRVGPITTTRRKYAPDGTLASETTRIQAPVEATRDTAATSTKEETRPAPPAELKRWLAVAGDHRGIKGGFAGLTTRRFILGAGWVGGPAAFAGVRF